MMKVSITETVLRDGNQSLIATRMPFSDFATILDKIDDAGYHSIECWGGATFDSCLRYLNEDPWERLRKIKERMPKTKLQMLLRGQNLLGYKHYSDDVVKKFVEHSILNGIDIIRIFDALNDFRNIEVAMEQTKKSGGHAQGAICYTISPIHNLANYVKLARELKTMGADSICIKDMSGILGPREAYDMIQALKDAVDMPIILHTHSTTGLGPITYYKAVEAGCDIIDTAISSFAGGTSQPATESLHYALQQAGYETGLNEAVLKEINDYFKPIKEKFLQSGVLEPYVLGSDTDALVYQVPGGMLSNLISQLKQQNALDRLQDVLQEVPRVRKDLGYPPLVTPMSQIVGVQATANVLIGERYSSVSNELKSYLRGEYGHAPGELNQDLVKQVLGDEKPIAGRYADNMEPQFEKAKELLGPMAVSDEDVLSYIAFPQIAEKFFKEREDSTAVKVNYAIKRV
ncbi:MAG: oxaloacetate decarboxylase subunit alpha [Syntrophomonadaceae bacterium]|nr:oxaloacetate decarboxylase subunit alpha [Syntrophomonadaceae bacterium]